MIRSYLTSAFRNLWKNKGFSAINILGLALGLTAFLLILQYVSFELSYDGYHERSEDLYRISLEQLRNRELITHSAENYPALGPVLVEEFPEVIDYARLYNLGAKNNMVVTYEDAPGEPVNFKHRRLLYASKGLLNMFSHEMVAGHAETALAEPFSMVITESYAKKYFGDENPIGKLLRMQDDDFNNELCKVSGVVKDVTLNTHFILSDYAEFYLMRVKVEGLPNTLAHIESVWESKFPGNPFQYFFLDEFFDAQYKNDRRFGSIFGVFSILAIIVGCLGLLGLSAFMAQQRFKEISVRKVLGASTGDLMLLLTRNFLLLILLANVLAWPIIAWVMNDWLSGFATRISLQPWMFVASGALVLLIALLTVSYQSYKVASSNPAEALRAE